ncbi:hypothetical protein BGZ60DRAFT_521862 [Tricladium varicosporioides]|nr:hypothetical protein BGZ60DRAFT_521862 [Hymenoscyphus varicosporioides]
MTATPSKSSGVELDDALHPNSLQALVRRERSDSSSSSSSNSSVVTVIYSPCGTSGGSTLKTGLPATKDPINRSRTPTQQRTPTLALQASFPPNPHNHTRSTSQFPSPLQIIPPGTQIPAFNQQISSLPVSTSSQPRRRRHTSEQRLSDIDYVHDTVAQLRPQVEALERRAGIASAPEIYSPITTISNQNQHRYQSVSEYNPRPVVTSQASRIGKRELSFAPSSLSNNPPFQGQTSYSSPSTQLPCTNINRSAGEQYPPFEPISFETQTPRSEVASSSSIPRPPISRRRRSYTICGENPFEQPVTAEEQAITNLVQHINRQNRQENARQIRQRSVSQTQINNSQSFEEIERAQRRADLLRSGGYRGTVLTKSPTQKRVSSANTSQASNTTGSTGTFPNILPLSNQDSDSISYGLQSSVGAPL